MAPVTRNHLARNNRRNGFEVNSGDEPSSSAWSARLPVIKVEESSPDSSLYNRDSFDPVSSSSLFATAWTGGQTQRFIAPTAAMATSSGLMSNTAVPGDGSVPLLCSVCPDTPKFSDVSHLLTHIASKGHLHHETQTKLKAHQDYGSAEALQRYEQWYREFGIEGLLVERLHAKQMKEAARSRRNRVISAQAPKPVSKRKTTHLNVPEDDAIKMESDESYGDTSQPQQLLLGESEVAEPVEYVTGVDMLALKGQVWPGMGKMDLANDEMRRTRNQRKPVSVIEKMRRASEGIETVQTVMTPDFEVEQVKDVYDAPTDPEEPDSSPPKKTRSRRKKPRPLQDISVNASRRAAPPSAPKIAPPSRMKTAPEHGHGHDENWVPQGTLGGKGVAPFRQQSKGDDVYSGNWTDDVAIRSAHSLGSFPYPTFHQHDEPVVRAGMRDVAPSHQFLSTNMSNRSSPLFVHRDMPGRANASQPPTRLSNRAQMFQGNSPHLSMGSFSNPATPFSPELTSRFQDTSRLPLLSGQHMPAQPHSPYHFSPGEPYRLHTIDSPYRGPQPNAFLGVQGHNPLLRHNRTSENGSQNGQIPATPSGSLGFLPINGEQDDFSPQNEQSPKDDSRSITEAATDDMINTEIIETAQMSFPADPLWDP